MAMVHSEPRMAVRTPARSGSADWGLVIRSGWIQALNRSSAPGNWAAASACTSARCRIESNSDQVPTTSGSTTRSTTRP